MTATAEQPILKQKTRILRPSEFRKIVDAIPKNDFKEKLEVLLYTGCRYNEIRELYRHPSRYSNGVIVIPSTKKKAIHNCRYVRLNKAGQRAVAYFLRSKTNLPNYTAWVNNLKRWCEYAGVDPTGMNCKTTRKTWESWLVMKYQKQIELIFLSQGHSQMTALKFYLMVPFTEQDIKDMEYYTDGWV